MRLFGFVRGIHFKKENQTDHNKKQTKLFKDKF